MLEVYPGVELVVDTPYIYLRRYRALIIADAHLGFEEAMAEAGLFLPRGQLKQLLQDIELAFNTLKVERVIIAGDLKHRFDRLGSQERREIEELMNLFKRKGVEVVFVRGNHDNYASIVTSRYGVEPTPHYRLGDILVIHGHQSIEEAGGDMLVEGVGIMIYGHEHPSISISDRLGKIAKFPCFLEIPLRIGGRTIKGLVAPAAGSYQAGTPITTIRSNYLSPITRNNGDIENAKPYILARGEGIFELPSLAYIQDLI
ncbi:MAG: metallophosphoesterase [Desulfurococcales archaeon]|nr:metallophosphoesterase [Desulfurococcales archaeon]